MVYSVLDRHAESGADASELGDGFLCIDTPRLSAVRQ
jgi:hypothetical protein